MLAPQSAKIFRSLAFLLLLPLLPASGCGTLSNGRGWGEDAIYPLHLARIPRAAFHALLDWQTLVPAAGALLFRIDDYDQKVTDWANEHHPIFGSRHGAETASDYISIGLYAEVAATLLATPSGNNPKEWAYSKLKGAFVEGMALGITSAATTGIQDLANRNRPDGSDKNSFPSGHVSGAFGAATLSNRNLDFIPMSNALRISLQAGNLALATLNGWGRIQGRDHFPSDVLAGAALGHFLTAFIHDAFMGLPEAGFAISIAPQKGGAMGLLHFAY